MIGRRTLKFATLDDAVRDAEHLLAVGYDQTGKWDLAQCCGHLAEWFRYQLDGFPPTPLWLRPVFWLLRNTVGPRMRQKTLASGTMRPGLPTLPQSVVPGGQDAAAAVDTLRRTIERWQAHAGPLQPSPLFGSVSKADWVTGHLIHCAHHLSFLVPKT